MPRMRWLPATLLLSLPFTLAAVQFVACSSDDSSTSTGPLPDASQPPATRLEAGAACGSSSDCETGLLCLFPATSTSTCSEFPVCTPAPPSPCPQPVTMCSCLAEPIQVCQGYAENAVDPTGAACDAGVIPTEAGVDSAAPPSDSGTDSTAPANDAGDAGGDAADAAGD
ncbi:MAG: hypothetical protein ACLQVI_32575 [Polyangiaceae bacterium]